MGLAGVDTMVNNGEIPHQQTYNHSSSNESSEEYLHDCFSTEGVLLSLHAAGFLVVGFSMVGLAYVSVRRTTQE